MEINDLKKSKEIKLSKSPDLFDCLVVFGQLILVELLELWHHHPTKAGRETADFTLHFLKGLDEVGNGCPV